MLKADLALSLSVQEKRDARKARRAIRGNKLERTLAKDIKKIAKANKKPTVVAAAPAKSGLRKLRRQERRDNRRLLRKGGCGVLLGRIFYTFLPLVQ